MKISTLHHDVDTLQQMLEQQQHQNKVLQTHNMQLQKQLAQLLQQNKVLHEQISQMQYQLNQLLRQQFGQKSEKKALNQNKCTNQSDKQKNTTSEHAEKNQARRKPLPLSLERESIEYTLAYDKRRCPGCSKTRTKFSEATYEQLEYVPARLKVIKHIRFKYCCNDCQGHCVEASMPNQPIDKGIPGPKLLTEVLISKYQDHLPLYRQEQRFKRYGMELSRKTLCDWVASSAFLLGAIVDYMKKELLRSVKIHTDDTTIPVQAKNKTQTCRLWVYLTNTSQGPPICIYDYSQRRSQNYPKKFLSGYRGYIQADAYPGYDKLYVDGKMIEVGCMSHCRRKFDEIVHQENSHPRTHRIISLIAELYGIEKQCHEMRIQDKYYYRRHYSKPALKKLYYYLVRSKSKILPQSALGKAIAYALNHWRALCNYLRHGELSIDNNAAERAIKPVVIGRKNYLFAGSHKGAENAAIIYSLIETCKMNNINTAQYFADVLAKIPNYKSNQIADLVPYHWANKN